MQNIRFTLNRFYPESLIGETRGAIRAEKDVEVFDAHRGVFVTTKVYYGILRGSEKFFAFDGQNSLFPLGNNDGTLMFLNGQECGIMSSDGLTSWDMDSGDLEIQGLKSNGRYKAAV